jgi:hypothetical protein
MTVASVQQTVEVSAVAATVNTENATIVNTMGNQEVTQLPANYRGGSTSPLGAIVASANVQQDKNGNIALTGSQPYQVDYSVDGTSSVNIALNSPASNMFPSTEMLGEFKVSAINNGAEFATTGDVTVTTKSGGNVIHGSAFEYLQNAALDAITYGSPAKQHKVWNTFGGSLSGPVVIPKLYNGHNKTFFFFDSEENRRPSSLLVINSVPTADMIAGNLNSVPGPKVIDPYTGAPYQNNSIPPCASAAQVDCLNPVAQKLFAKYIGRPNFSSSSTTGNQRFLMPLQNLTNGYDVRIDQYIGSKNLLYGRWTWKHLPTQTPTGSGFGGAATEQLLPPTNNDETDKNLVISDSYTISGQLVNEFRFGISRLNSDQSFPYQGVQVVNDLGLTGLDQAYLARQGTAGAFPGFDFSSGTGFTNIGHDTLGPVNSKVMQFGNNLSWIKGKHTMKFGVDYRTVEYDRVDQFGASDGFGSFTFLGTFSGNAFADLLLGLPTSNQVFVTGPFLEQKSKHFSAFAQDEWHVSKSLTVSFGLRWELMPPFSETNGNIGNFDPTTGNVIIPDIAAKVLPPPAPYLYTINACSLNPLPNPALPCTNVLTASQAHYPEWLRDTYWKDFDPRAGVAWRPFGNDKTVFRAGLGLFTVPSLGWEAYMMTGTAYVNSPFFVNGFSNGQPLFRLPQATFGNGNPSPSVVGTFYFNEGQDRHFRDPQSAQWNVTIEREFATSWTGRASYIGENSYRLPFGVDLNQCHASVSGPCIKPFPQLGKIGSFVNGAFSNYQGLELQASHRMANGFYLQATYDVQKTLTASGDMPSAYGTESGNGRVNDRFNIRNNRGNDPGPRRQRLLVTSLYALPFGQGRPFLSNANHVVNGILGGWQLSGILLSQTGPFITAYLSNRALSAANLSEVARSATVRPDQIGDCNLSNPTPNRWNNLSAFVPTPQGAGRT